MLSDRWDALLLCISAGLTNSTVVVFNRWDVVWHALNPSGRCARCSAISAVATAEMFVIIPAKKWDFFCSVNTMGKVGKKRLTR